MKKEIKWNKINLIKQNQCVKNENNIVSNINYILYSIKYNE